MTKKVDIDTLKKILTRNEIGTRKSFEIIEDIMHVLQAEQEAKEPAVKKQFVIVMAAEGDLPEEGYALGWVMQIPEDENPGQARASLMAAAAAYNQTARGRHFPVETVGEAFEKIPANISKEAGLWVKTRIPVMVLPMHPDRRLPLAPEGGAL